jgi:hypothetical protein
VGITGERLIRRGEEITQVSRDPVRLCAGKILEVLFAAEDGDRREVAVLVLDGEVGDEARSRAGVLDIASLQCGADLIRRTVQGVAADDGVDRLVLLLGDSRNGTDAGRGEQRGRGGGPGAAQRAAPRKPASQ